MPGGEARGGRAERTTRKLNPLPGEVKYRGLPLLWYQRYLTQGENIVLAGASPCGFNSSRYWRYGLLRDLATNYKSSSLREPGRLMRARGAHLREERITARSFRAQWLSLCDSHRFAIWGERNDSPRCIDTANRFAVCCELVSHSIVFHNPIETQNPSLCDRYRFARSP